MVAAGLERGRGRSAGHVAGIDGVGWQGRARSSRSIAWVQLADASPRQKVGRTSSFSPVARPTSTSTTSQPVL